MKSNKEIYKSHLESTPSLLRETLEKLEIIIVNLAMSGELAELNDQFDEDEDMAFKYQDFRQLNDYNVQLLYSLFDVIQDKRSEIININSLQDSADEEDLPF